MGRRAPGRRQRYASAVAGAAVVLAIGGVASGARDDDGRGNGIPNGSISLKEIDVPIYGAAAGGFAPVEGTAEFTRIHERALPSERIHGHLTGSVRILLTNTTDAPATAQVRWLVDGKPRGVRTVTLEPGAQEEPAFLMAGRLSGGDEHDLALEVAGAGVRFEARLLTLQGLPGAPKDDG